MSGEIGLIPPETLSEELMHGRDSAIAVVQNEVRAEPAQKQESAGYALRKLAGFFLLLLVAAFATQVAVSSLMRHVKSGSMGSWNQSMHGRANADIVVSGSSRATYHYDPRVIAEETHATAFNIGKVGSQTDVQVAVLKAYLAHNRKPRILIHNLDAFSFVTTTQIFDPGQYIPYLGDDVLYRSLVRIDPDLVKSRYLPLYGYAVQDMDLDWLLSIRAVLGGRPKEPYYDGFSPRDKTWTDEFERFKDANPNGVSFGTPAQGIDDLQQLIDVCKQNNIQLILVYSPEYHGMQSLTTNRKQIFSLFEKLARENNVPLWDYSSWEHGDDKSYFYNSQHLNAAGAELFSAELATRLESYIQSKPGLVGVLGSHQSTAEVDSGVR